MTKRCDACQGSGCLLVNGEAHMDTTCPKCGGAGWLTARYDMGAIDARAVRIYHDTYGPPSTDTERLLVQRGIDAAKAALDSMTQEEALRERS